MSETRIQQLEREIAQYKQAIRDARDALEAAEQELEEVLDMAQCYTPPRNGAPDWWDDGACGESWQDYMDHTD